MRPLLCYVKVPSPAFTVGTLQSPYSKAIIPSFSLRLHISTLLSSRIVERGGAFSYHTTLFAREECANDYPLQILAPTLYVTFYRGLGNQLGNGYDVFPEVTLPQSFFRWHITWRGDLMPDITDLGYAQFTKERFG